MFKFWPRFFLEKELAAGYWVNYWAIARHLLDTWITLTNQEILQANFLEKYNRLCLKSVL